ncbi:MAG: TIGR00282 family metallophosphoesterase [Thermodesulfobacteriota bacterium]|uniref:Metallophosphoesterase n=1 Tax=Geoalkalibacter subterraneus TaxID=483547 RepID=A0A0B5FIJ8_9BACT|nr:TIGR00282 family metallophosphoesterase [Geoalkalibacter subterraneus]AJF07168.1 metallophosphoesterase [Geoalkalibacter subterraneus]MDY6850186.1 TIGR00282 family metallophosphoesterase [Thermodesulfobacteriota bacterium]
MKILFVGDIVGRPGRQALKRRLDHLVDRHQVDLVVANGENSAGGFGLTAEIARELFALGVHVLTSGNHIWDKKEAFDLLERESRVLRPANYPPGLAGYGSGVFFVPDGTPVAVVNLEGRVFMNNLDCPFRAADRLLEGLRDRAKVILVDFHAEASSEKIAFGHYLAGRVSAVVGTHTHVQTADERILGGGTAFITDVGMTGSLDSVIGIQKEIAVEKFLKQVPMRFEVAKKHPVLCAVLLDVDADNGCARSIERIFQEVS